MRKYQTEKLFNEVRIKQARKKRKAASKEINQVKKKKEGGIIK